MKRTLAAVALLLASACASAPPRPPVVIPTTPQTYTLFVHVCDGTPCERDNESHKVPEAQVEIEVHGTVYVEHADGAGNLFVRDLVAGTRTVCAGGAPSGYKRACLAVTLPRPEAEGGQDVFLLLERDLPRVLPLRADGKIFRASDGQPWRYRGVSAFKLLDVYAHGGDWRGFLAAYRGFNVARVWPYVEWGLSGWDTPGPDVAVRFAADMAQEGWYVEFTLLTDESRARVDQAKQLVAALVAARPPNVLLEAGNEPTTHKSIDTAALRSTLEGSGFLYSSGDYEDSSRFYGSYGTAHTARTQDFPRRAHDLLEYFLGGGPNTPTDPPHRVPWVADEPAKPADVPGATDADWLAYFGGVSIMGAGGTWHCESCKYARLPDANEARIAALALQAMNAFPADAPLGGYRRIVEDGQSSEARTYVVGGYMVRSQQRGTRAPESGWTPIDEAGVLWRR